VVRVSEFRKLLLFIRRVGAMIKRVKIQGYKSLDDVEFELQPLTVLIGPNAAGKSNVLDALHLLSRIAQMQNLNDAFEPPYRGSALESFAFGPAGIQGLLEKERASFSIEVDIELSDDVVEEVSGEIRDAGRMRPEGDGAGGNASSRSVEETFLRYHVEIEIRPKTGVLDVASERLVAIERDGSLKEKPPLDVAEARRKVAFDGIIPSSFVSWVDVGRAPDVAAVRKELARWSFHDVEPRERMRAPSPVKEVHRIGPRGENLAAFLNTLRATRPKQFAAIEKSLRMIVPSVEGLRVEVNRRGELELDVVEDGRPVPLSLVSDGTLRVLALLTLGSARPPASLLGIEEPENGLHPRRLELLTRYLETLTRPGRTQVIVTTHSPLLADALPRASLVAFTKRGGRTVARPVLDIGPFGRSRARGDGGATLPSVSTMILRGDLDA
jgi:predicted ATPase